MEHPLRVDELPRTDNPPAVTAEPPPAPQAAPAPALPPLPNLSASDVLFLRPSDSQYKTYLPAANTRTQLSPALRAVCKTEHAVAVMIDWVQSNQLSFAVRCGGHSYEGFSQSTNVVIDLRGMAGITVDTEANLVTAGSGASLYQIYQAVAAQGLALQAGSCPTVGISGHILGGGHGLLARSHGLTCDSLDQVTVVDSQSQIRVANATSEPDLYWACRGGRRRQFWHRHRVQAARLSAEECAGVRRHLDVVAGGSHKAVCGVAGLGAERSEQHYLHHEGAIDERQQGHATLHRPVGRQRK